MTARWTNAFLGAWLLATAFVAGPHSPEFGDHIVLGLAVYVLAFLAMALPKIRYANAALGAWTVLSPFVFGYMDRGMAVNDIVVGVLIAGFALKASRPPRRRPAAEDHAPLAG